MHEIIIASGELEDSSSLLRKFEDKEDSLRNRRKKIDCDAPEESIEEIIIIVTPTSDADKRAEAESKELIQARITSALSTKTESASKLKALVDLRGEQQTLLTRLYMQRIHINPSESKKISAIPGVVQSLRLRSLVQLQCIVSGCVDVKDLSGVFSLLVKDLNGALTPTTVEINKISAGGICETLIDICRVAWQMGYPESALQCYESAGRINCPSTPILRVKMDLCKASQMVAESSVENVYKLFTHRLTAREIEGHSISRRIEAMKVLERILPICQSRIKDFVLVQEICITMWNTILPLLQHHLRKYAHKALQMLGKALEERDAPLTLLRARIHFELCKCESQADYVSKAREEADKALSMDYGSLLDETPTYQSLLSTAVAISGTKSSLKGTAKGIPLTVETAPVAAINPDLDRMRSMDHLIKPIALSLGLRLSVYDSPSNVEDQVILLLQQGIESQSCSTHTDILFRASAAMEGVLFQSHRNHDSNGKM